MLSAAQSPSAGSAPETSPTTTLLFAEAATSMGTPTCPNGSFLLHWQSPSPSSFATNPYPSVSAMGPQPMSSVVPSKTATKIGLPTGSSARFEMNEPTHSHQTVSPVPPLSLATNAWGSGP